MPENEQNAEEFYVMIIDKKTLCAATPDEKTLAGLIESDDLHVLVLGEADSVFSYDSLLTAAQLYRARHGIVKFHVLTPNCMAGTLGELARTCEFVDVLDGEDMRAILTCFLGCRFVVLMADDVTLLSAAQYFCLPVIRLKKGSMSPRVCNGVLEVGDMAAILAGAFFVFRTGKYEAQLLSTGAMGENI